MTELLELVFAIVSQSLKDWEDPDVRRYFELAYEDPKIRLYIKTDSSIAARELARGVAEMLVERLKSLRIEEERRLSDDQKRLSYD